MVGARAESGRILFCNCSYMDVVPEPTRSAVRAALAGVEGVVAVHDLCGLAARCDPLLQEWAQAGLTVVACYPRAVRWLFHAGGAELPAECTVHNMRTEQAATIIQRLGVAGAGAGPELSGASADWTPWFPVIDYSRCCNCKQCRDFCLFGVYELDAAGKVVVAKPAQCKTHCPACARICPEAAIMFPKLGEAPIDGAEIDDEAAVRARVKLNVDEILGADVYAALARRQVQAKQKLIKRRELAQALAERDRCSACATKNGVRPCSSSSPAGS